MPAGTLTGWPAARRAGAALCAALAVAGLLWPGAQQARAQTPLPQPRVAYDMHAARINQIRPTPDLERLVSVGQDKTVRVWRSADLRLLRTIHVPSEPGEEGSLRSLVVTPDGREVIVGGWTGLAWSGRAQLYRFDLATGRLLQTLRGLPALVESLALSADGRRLAVGLGGRAGLRVLDMPSGRELLSDTEYGERVGFADFSADGTLATTSADGCLRLYGPDGRLAFRAEYPPRADPGPACRGSALGGVRFSPDGSQLAFGLQDRVEVVVMDVASKTVTRRLSVDEPLQRSLCCPNWSVDGTRLHMHGAFSGDGPTPLYRVALAPGAAPGPTERLPVGRMRFTNVLPLPSGELLVSTIAPSLARIARDGRVLAEALPPNGDFRFPWAAWRIDAQGQRLLLPMDAAGADRRFFSLASEPTQAFRPARTGDEAGLDPPNRGGPDRVDAVLDEFGYQHPVRVNGQALRLKPFQSVRSWAGGGGRVALGTQWSVLVAGSDGLPLWEQDLPAPAHQVIVSGDGRWVVAAVGDGSLRWYAADTGREALGLFLHASGRDWIAWRPDGHYASSPAGDQYLGWLVNQGDAREPDFLRAVQFERTLYRPDLVRASLQSPGRAPASRGLGDTLAGLAAPRVRIESVSADTREVRFSVRSLGSPVREVGVFTEGIPVLDAAARRVPAGSTEFTRTVSIPPGLPLDRIRVEAESDLALGIDEAAVARPLAASGAQGRLWVLAIGVEKFEGFAACGRTVDCSATVVDLPNAPSDAAVIAALLRERFRGVFSDVRTTLLAHRLGSTPTKAAIVAGLKALEAAQPEDTVFVFLGSHGFAGGEAAGEYYFLPADAQSSALDRVIALSEGRPAPAGSSTASLLSGQELNEALRRVPGRRILAIDSCHAGAAGAPSNPYAIAKRSASAQVAVLSSSTGDELSYEFIDPAVPHGAFTHAFIHGLKGAADLDRDGALTLQEAFQFIGPEVQRTVARLNAAERRRNPRHQDFTQTPMLHAGEALRSSRLAAAR